jgi:catechol 2,3-dioxygenase-like lactoylglutathione lyase family enzyme
MKRLHVHVAVADLEQSLRFYSMLFGAEPAVRKPDYAKWMLDDPHVNFAISHRGEQPGLSHLGLQAENSAELEEIGTRLKAAEAVTLSEQDTTCCYAQSDKYWTEDPQGVRWESFHTHGETTIYGGHETESGAACCIPEHADGVAQTAKPSGKAACCDPKDAGRPGCCA